MESTENQPPPEAKRPERYGIRYEGHDVEVGVTPGNASAEGALVFVDGTRLRPEQLRAGSHDIGFTTSDGVEIRLHLAGRAERPLGRVALRRADGYWVNLPAREDDTEATDDATPPAAA